MGQGKAHARTGAEVGASRRAARARGPGRQGKTHSMFIVKSGTGYFTGFSHSSCAQVGSTPRMVSDPLSAKRLERDEAERVIVELDRLGFVAELVELVRSSINGYCYVIFSPSDDLREALAAYAHRAWSGWRRYVLSKSTLNSDGTMTVPAWAVARWERQMNTAYCDLSEIEQESDRDKADKMLAIMRGHGGR